MSEQLLIDGITRAEVASVYYRLRWETVSLPRDGTSAHYPQDVCVGRGAPLSERTDQHLLSPGFALSSGRDFIRTGSLFVGSPY